MDKKYSREEYVYLAKLYEKAERYPEMVTFIYKFIELNPILTNDERTILSAGFKNIIGSKRSSWRLIEALEKKEEKKGGSSLTSVREVKTKIENEMRNICDDVQSTLDKFLIPSAKDSDTKVFYLKFKADYYRYRSEFSVDKEYQENIDLADKIYKSATELAEKDLPISNPTRLGLALNFSVFYYEGRNLREEACQIAKTNFEEAIKILDDLERGKAKDTILIIQLLKENLIIWNNEMNEDEENN